MEDAMNIESIALNGELKGYQLTLEDNTSFIVASFWKDTDSGFYHIKCNNGDTHVIYKGDRGITTPVTANEVEFPVVDEGKSKKKYKRLKKN